MKTIVGLGNPGEKYKKTRHNIGFMILNELNKKMELKSFRVEKKHRAGISKNKEFILVKPQTFMNDSGHSVASVVNFYKTDLNEVIIVHDDVDLSLGKIKISFSEGAAGHKGVLSIVKNLGSNNFWRIRVGIADEDKDKDKKETDKFVLSNFAKKELPVLNEVIENVTDELSKILKTKIEPKKISLD